MKTFTIMLLAVALIAAAQPAQVEARERPTIRKILVRPVQAIRNAVCTGRFCNR